MRCTSIEKNKCCKCINQKLTDNYVGLLLNLLHIDVVHPTSGEGVGLLSSAPITVSILRFRALRGIVSSLPTLETSNVTQILLGGCHGVGMVLTIAASIPIAILWANMVV